jgi:hypothetical protein
MKFSSKQFVHWITTLAILFASLAPAISQAVSLTKVGHGFSMELCSANGKQIEIGVQITEDSDLTELLQSCPYCLTHSSTIPIFDIHLQFSSPQPLSLLPQLYYQSPKPLFSWAKLPSQAPPHFS